VKEPEKSNSRRSKLRSQSKSRKNPTPGGPNFGLRATISGGIISGYDGCNRFSGPVDQPNQIFVGQRACADSTDVYMLDLADPIAHLLDSTLTGGLLEIPARGSIPAAIFVKE
jgi:hypothetical protein